jgi:hypothetical protein
MLGLSFAAQPEHETISVRRINGTSFIDLKAGKTFAFRDT